jgi:thioesterase domain-containing protein
MKAARRYEAQPYPGQIVLLQAENGIGKVDHIWKGLATEGLAVHELPGTHLGIIHGTESTLWAAHLAACLEEAQSQRAPRAEKQYAGI